MSAASGARASSTLTYQHAEIEDVVDVIPLAGGFDGVGNIGDGSWTSSSSG